MTSPQHGVAGRALLHELGEDAGFVGVLPLRRHLGEDAVAHAVTLPVGDDLVSLDAPGFVVHAVGDLLARVSRIVEILELWQQSSG